MSTTCPPAPVTAADLDAKLKSLPAGTLFVRFHSPDYSASAFNSHLGKDMTVATDGARFSPFTNSAGTNVPTLYCGSTDTAAALESVFHDVPHAPDPEYPRSKLKKFVLSRFKSTRDINVFVLINSQLRQVAVDGRTESLDEAEIIHSSPAQYPLTRGWAQHFHRSIDDLDGLAWRPRLGGEGESYIFFGPQFENMDFILVDDRIAIDTGTGQALIEAIAAAAHIRLIGT